MLQPNNLLRLVPYTHLIPANELGWDELARLYNITRADYLVPMPMDGPRLQEHAHAYDIALDKSIVAIDGWGEPIGLGLLGIRDWQAWITRFGVVSSHRGQGIGMSIVNALLDAAWTTSARNVALEIICGNDAARALFDRAGFSACREMLVLRRPPLAPAEVAVQDVHITTLRPHEIEWLLQRREDQPTWINATASLRNLGKLTGLRARTLDGEESWIIFHRDPYVLSHFVFGPWVNAEIAMALLASVHQVYRKFDTKIENIPVNSPYWPILKQLGYVLAFRRCEMVIDRPAPLA
ncbi:MAG: GNAT family N-acetyltransferase [Phototrophicaceae bacterium]